MSQTALSVMAAVAVLSIIFSTIMIAYSKKIYSFVSPLLGFFEHKSKVHFLELKLEDQLQDHIIIIGAHRVGGPVVKYLTQTKISFVVMDFNPHVVENLREKGIKVIYGDVGDPEMLENLQLQNAKLIISTATDLADNEILLAECRRKKVRAKVVVRALDHDHAEALKALGADFVILPERVSGNYLVNQLKLHWPNIHFTGLE